MPGVQLTVWVPVVVLRRRLGTAPERHPPTSAAITGGAACSQHPAGSAAACASMVAQAPDIGARRQRRVHGQADSWRAGLTRMRAAPWAHAAASAAQSRAQSQAPAPSHRRAPERRKGQGRRAGGEAARASVEMSHGTHCQRCVAAAKSSHSGETELPSPATWQQAAAEQQQHTSTSARCTTP